MDIKARIVARKIVFCYFFEQYFLVLSGKKTALLEEVEKIADFLPGEEGEQEINLQQKMSEHYFGSTDEEVAYLIKRFFEYQGGDEPKEIKPDRDYIK